MESVKTFAGFKSRLAKARKRLRELINERVTIIPKLMELDGAITKQQQLVERLEKGAVSSKDAAA